ncbi:MAG: GNAT family N-acetyltransferase [Rhodobacterales bacterium]|nr:GNAT family N-acetyltransferase [Rhodobacterales bacterium]
MIVGKYCQIRPIEERDLDFLQMLAVDRNISSRLVGWDFPPSQYGQRKWFDATHNSRTTRRFLVEDLGGTPLGITGLWDIDWHSRVALTATKLYAPNLKQKGIGTDSIKILMAYAFYDVGLNRLWGAILDFNGPSFGAYAKKCGWRGEGILREEVWREGNFHDLYRVAILKSEFDALNDSEDYINRAVPADTTERVSILDEWWAPELVGKVPRD